MDTGIRYQVYKKVNGTTYKTGQAFYYEYQAYKHLNEQLLKDAKNKPEFETLYKVETEQM